MQIIILEKICYLWIVGSKYIQAWLSVIVSKRDKIGRKIEVFENSSLVLGIV